MDELKKSASGRIVLIQEESFRMPGESGNLFTLYRRGVRPGRNLKRWQDASIKILVRYAEPERRKRH